MKGHELKTKFWFTINIFFTIVYLVWRFFFTIPFGYGIFSVTIGIALLVVEALGMVEAFIHYINMNASRKYEMPIVPEELYPDVDVFVATYSEEPELLKKTLNGCVHMEYPDKSKVHIYLCDDNRRPEMRALAAEMGVNYLDRPDNKGAKAGNLNNALLHSSSPYVVTFDADMIPQRRFLMKTIPYFIDAEMKNEGKKEEDKIKLGFVQTPQNFHNPDLFQFNLFSEGRIPNEQDYFYKDIQVARTRTNSVIYGGSNTVLSREALMEVGGFYTKAITEDFATGILIEKKGYVSLALSEPLASGLSPTDLHSLIQQRVRWARGVISTGRKMHIYTCRELTFAQKMNYWASIWYWYAPLKRLIYYLAPVMYAVFGFIVFKCTLWEVLLFWLPMFVSSNISLRLLSGNIRTTKWTGIYETIVFPYMLIPILLETFGIKLHKFKVTDKSDNAGGKEHNYIYMIPFVIMAVLSVIGIINCLRVIFDSSSFGPIVVLFWLILNLYYIIMSLMFIDGRVLYRHSDRMQFVNPCKALIEGKVREGYTKDISEGGVAIEFDRPYYVEHGDVMKVMIDWEVYSAEVLAKVVFIKQINNVWNYSVVVTDYLDSYLDWLQIVYDRIPTLPATIKKDSGIFDDIRINTERRVESPSFQKRKYPRIRLDMDAEMTADGVSGNIHVADFNFECMGIAESLLYSKISIVLFKDFTFECTRESTLRNGGTLYRIENMESIMYDEPRYIKLLDCLVEQNKAASSAQYRRAAERERLQKESDKKKAAGFDEIDTVFKD